MKNKISNSIILGASLATGIYTHEKLDAVIFDPHERRQTMELHKLNACEADLPTDPADLIVELPESCAHKASDWEVIEVLPYYRGVRLLGYEIPSSKEFSLIRSGLIKDIRTSDTESVPYGVAAFVLSLGVLRGLIQNWREFHSNSFYLENGYAPEECLVDDYADFIQDAPEVIPKEAVSATRPDIELPCPIGDNPNELVIDLTGGDSYFEKGIVVLQD